MAKLKAGLVALLVFIIASAVVAYYAQGAISAYFAGRENVLDAEGRLALSKANARQVDAVTVTMRQQSAFLSVLVMFGALQGSAVVALLVWLIVHERRANRAMDRMLAAQRPYHIDEFRPLADREPKPWDVWEPVALKELQRG